MARPDKSVANGKLAAPVNVASMICENGQQRDKGPKIQSRDQPMNAERD